jgi:hypothetical protein
MFKVIKTAEMIAEEENKQTTQQRIAELRTLLAESDFKVLPDYDKDSTTVKLERQAWRNELRTLEQA